MADSDRGRAVSDRAILTVFAETDESPLYAWEVAEELPVSTDELAAELDDMTERGLLERDDDYAPGTVWRLDPDANVDDVGDDEGTETPVEAQATGTGTQGPPLDQETVESPPAEPGERPSNPPYELPTDAIQTFDPPGTPEQKDRRREALRHAYGYLRERAEADREAFVEDVYPTYPGAYEDPDDGWWEAVIRPGLEQLPDVEPVDGEQEEWRYVGRATGER